MDLSAHGRRERRADDEGGDREPHRPSVAAARDRSHVRHGVRA
jgi:hypothetical protein